MRIAMIGQKGLPATYGGIENHVEQLSARLVARGHDVVAYTRPSYSDPRLNEHAGIRLKSLPSIPTKHLDAITHSLLASTHSRRQPFDIVHYHAIGPCLTAPLARRSGRRLVATIHGQDWRRAKWNGLATKALQLSEEMALRVPDATISVSSSLAQHYEERRVGNVHYIPNGVSITEADDPDFVAGLGLRSGQYVVYIGRLVPEKGAHYLAEAWKRVDTDRRLVIVGDSSFTGDYVASLQRSAGDAVFTGYLYGSQLASMFRHAGLFVLPSDLEGLPIVLLEALAYGTPVLASDIAPNREVLGHQGRYFRAGDVDDLTEQLGDLIPRIPALKAEAEALRGSLLHEYDWERVTDETVALYASLLTESH